MHFPPAATHASGPDWLLVPEHPTRATITNPINAFIVRS
jgi:hypothetical protein